MDIENKLKLKPHQLNGGQVKQLDGKSWHLEVPPGPSGRYRLAQLDDYSSKRREFFPWRPPISLRLRARASARCIPGTWGFGFWNDPFSLSMGFGGGERRLPNLPETAWFFFASPQNYLSIRDDLPPAGRLAATFRSRHLSMPVTILVATLMPLFALPPLARLFRRLGRQYIRQDSVELSSDVATWGDYRLDWSDSEVYFFVDGKNVLHTQVSPHGPLGLVLWIDNQYAALPPNGRLRYGTLPNPEKAWIEIADLMLTSKG